jgi:SAM-dependent methyltransferase
MRQIRHEAYGDDIGQHSWVMKSDLESDVAKLQLTNASRLLDLGCGSGGVLAFVVGLTGCHGSGIDLSAPAITAARTRARSLGLGEKLSFRQADLNQPLPYLNASFNAVLCLDVIVHLADRLAIFREIKRILIPGGSFLFTDAAVITGAVSADEFRLRANRGFTQFVPPGVNERVLKASGFEIIDVIDRTPSLLRTAKGRLDARLAHERELKDQDMEGATDFEREQQYLGIVVELSQRRALSRMIYLARTGTT